MVHLVCGICSLSLPAKVFFPAAVCSDKLQNPTIHQLDFTKDLCHHQCFLAVGNMCVWCSLQHNYVVHNAHPCETHSFVLKPHM